MIVQKKEPVILWLSLPLAAIVTVSSLVGLTNKGFYSLETFNWQVQSTGQDLVDLFLITPALLITSILAFQKRKGAILLWGGVIIYLLYTYLIYCFAVHFNKLFILYCLALGLSFFSMGWFLFSRSIQPAAKENFSGVPRRFISIYFILLSILFYFFWLSEIIPAINNNQLPKSIKENGLLTNAVQVIDLAVFLPGMFIAGIFLWKKKWLGYLIAPVVLTFFILMDITIGGLVVLMKEKGLAGTYLLTIMMGLLAAISAVLLVIYIKQIKNIA